MISNDQSLDAEKKLTSLKALQKNTPNWLVQQEAKANLINNYQDRDNILRESGADDWEIKDFRRRELGDQAAANLEKLDQQRQDWGKRLTKYREHVKEALEIYERFEETFYAAYTYNSLGISYQNLNDYASAENYFNLAVGNAKKVEDNLGLTNALHNLGDIKRSQNKNNEAKKILLEAKAIAEKLAGRDITLIYEPGRAVMANAGILVTEVEYLKTSEERNFAIVDAAMNDLIRPALYQAWQAIIPVEQRDDIASAQYDVVGPICETGDFLGKDRTLAIRSGDLLAVRSAGAYGFTMSSNYNSRPRAAEVMVDGSESYLIRQRETLSQLWQGESLLPL